jgi:hypothetical protein
VNVGYQVIDCLRLKIGYSFLYVSNVLRAPKQLSRNITPNQSAAILFSSAVAVSDTDRPTGSKRTESLWIQGANIGLEFNF